MNNKNRDNEGTAGSKESEFPNETSIRARNRTVMLSPEITGQVRARMSQDVDDKTSDFAPYNEVMQKPENAGGARASAYLDSNPNLSETAPTNASYEAPARSVPQRNDTERNSFNSSNFTVPGAAFNNQGSAEPRVESRTIQQPPAPAATATKGDLVWAKETPIVGFLVTYDLNPLGDVYELRSGRLIISNEPANAGNYFVIDDESVSPMHAILRISNTGEVQILDQLSEAGTRIKRFGQDEEDHISGEKSTVEHGDMLKFGERTYHVCLIALAE